jgi:hypothetical protein
MVLGAYEEAHVETLPYNLFRPYRACRFFDLLTQGSASLHPGLIYFALSALLLSSQPYCTRAFSAFIILPNLLQSCLQRLTLTDGNSNPLSSTLNTADCRLATGCWQLDTGGWRLATAFMELNSVWIVFPGEAINFA